MSNTSKNISIYSLSEDLRSLYNEIYINEGELTDALENSLSELTEDKIPAKLTGVGAILRKLSFDKEYIKEEKKILDNKIKYLENAENKLKDRVHNLLNIMDEDKITTPTGTFYKRNTESVEIDDVESLPPDLYVLKKSPVSKSDIKKFIKANGEVDGVRIITKESLTYKKSNSK